MKGQGYNVNPIDDPVYLEFALSIHQSQRLILDKVVVDICRNEFSIRLPNVRCS